MATVKNPKYIFVVGGVISGVGKGITTSSIAQILKQDGYRVTAMKIDPYVNVDAGTMNPTEHGEVFVLDDGYETDQDMGNYERFLNTTISSDNYMTTGRVYQSVIEKERAMYYKGACVQVVPHVPLEVISRIKNAQKNSNAECVVIEIGGTVGEYENILFLEAARILKTEQPHDVAVVMVSYLPIPGTVGEMKTKPTQHAVRMLQGTGLWPDMLIARSSIPLDTKRKEKLALFCNIQARNIISAPDVESIYDVPINFRRERVGEILHTVLALKKRTHKSAEQKSWEQFVKKVHTAKEELRIAIVGKYFDTGDFVLSDSYLSIIEAIKHAAFTLNKKPIISWLNSSEFEEEGGRIRKDIAKKLEGLRSYDGVLVPGGFGSRGIEGKINVIKFVREHKIPYFGICYGMQLAVIEFARHVAGIKNATSKELDPQNPQDVITIMEYQKELIRSNKYGGSMRLGAYIAKITPGTLVHDAYKKNSISERHRHRYEVNTEYIDVLTKHGLVFSGTSPNGLLMEFAELPKKVHPFFVGTQAHPEFLSHPLFPHPLFSSFIKAASIYKKNRNK
jgi:CTP synthase